MTYIYVYIYDIILDYTSTSYQPKYPILPHPTPKHLSHEVHFKVDLRERLGGDEGISAVTDDMGSRLKVNAVESLGVDMARGHGRMEDSLTVTNHAYPMRC